MIENYFTSGWNFLFLILGIAGIFAISFLIFKKTEKKVAEYQKAGVMNTDTDAQKISFDADF